MQKVTGLLELGLEKAFKHMAKKDGSLKLPRMQMSVNELINSNFI